MKAACLVRSVRTLAVLCLAGWLSASTAPAALVIDGFTDFQYIEVYGVNAVNPASDSMASADILGGQRDITVTRTSGNGGGIFVDVNGTMEHAITYSSDPATAGSALISYPNLGGFDLTQAGTNQWIEVSTTSDLGGNVVITVYSSPTRFSTATVPVAADPTYAFTVAQVPFVDFVAAGPDGGAEFASVSAITLQLDGSNAAVDMIVHHLIADGIPPQTPNDPPTCTSPADITVEIGQNENSAVVTYTEAAVTVDPDCAPATVTFDPPSGSTFPVGTTEVLVMVTDECGQAAVCPFKVTVKKTGVLPLSPGYWKNHPCAWPACSLTLGSKTYNKCELLKILKSSKGGDASMILANQLIAAKLNLLNGADPDPISGLVAQGDALLSLYSGKLPYKVKTSSAVGAQMTAIADALAALWY
jgi:hypothetical protein